MYVYVCIDKNNYSLTALKFLYRNTQQCQYIVLGHSDKSYMQQNFRLSWKWNGRNVFSLIFNTKLFILRLFVGEYCYLFPIRNLPSCAEPTLLIQEVRGMRQNKETYHVICWRKRITLLCFCLEGPLFKEGRTAKVSITCICLREEIQIRDMCQKFTSSKEYR